MDKITVNNNNIYYNIQIAQKNCNEGAVISGYIRDIYTKALKNALICLFLFDGTLIRTIETDEYGYFFMMDVPNIELFIVSTLEGYYPSNPINIFPKKREVLQIPEIILESIKERRKSQTLTGMVFCEGKPLNDVKILLSCKTSHHWNYSTTTDQDGFFSFPDLEDLEYGIYLSKNGWISLEEEIDLFCKGKVVNKNFQMKKDTSLQKQLICGVVSQGAELLEHKKIALYHCIHLKATIYAISYTNCAGMYIFRDVPNGTYIIKALI